MGATVRSKDYVEDILAGEEKESLPDKENLNGNEAIQDKDSVNTKEGGR